MENPKLIDLDKLIELYSAEVNPANRISPRSFIEHVTGLDIVEMTLGDRFVIRFASDVFDLKEISKYVFIWRTFRYEVFAIQEGKFTPEEGCQVSYKEVIFRKEASREPNEHAMRAALTVLAGDAIEEAVASGMNHTAAKAMVRLALVAASSKVNINSVMIEEDPTRNTYVFERKMGSADGSATRQIIDRPSYGEVARNSAKSRA